MIQIRTYKDKEKEGGEGRPQLGGQLRVPSLLANGRFQAWLPLECSMLGGQWGSTLFGGHIGNNLKTSKK
jgi:hypothetical protein